MQKQRSVQYEKIWAILDLWYLMNIYFAQRVMSADSRFIVFFNLQINWRVKESYLSRSSFSSSKWSYSIRYSC